MTDYCWAPNLEVDVHCPVGGRDRPIGHVETKGDGDVDEHEADCNYPVQDVESE